MYKNISPGVNLNSIWQGFNPCFNGSMYKNTEVGHFLKKFQFCFNPCFNGSMYKNYTVNQSVIWFSSVSILVLMDLCIKTMIEIVSEFIDHSFNPCFNGSMYKNTG